MLLLLSRICFSLVILVSTGLSIASDAPARKVLVVGIDGCRWDALSAARTPHLDRLIHNGALSTNTSILGPRRTDSDTISGPGWSSIFTGVWSDKHGVTDNTFQSANYERYPHFFRLLRQAQPNVVTASFCDWKPIAEKIVSDATVSFSPDEKLEGAAAYVAADEQVAQAAEKYLRDNNPDAVCVYLGQVDETGHAHGFHPTVPEYIKAIETVDQHLGDLLKAIDERPTAAREQWLVIVTTDHGGQGTGHGGGHETEDIRRVFLISSGLGTEEVKSAEPARQTYLVDVVPTALAWLRVTSKPEWELDGTPFAVEAVTAP